MEKIEEIRKKPEHIRRRYVWFFVGVSMVFIMMIWVFSFEDWTSDQVMKPGSYDNLSDVANQFEIQKDSVQATVDNVKNAIGQDVVNKMQDGNVKENLNK
ncbi:MAG: hypothetical protein Q8M12_02630 [bacterium]|nr:hypothetical protein [bacterium]